MSDLREPLAAYAHEGAWSTYMGYFLDRLGADSDGNLIIPAAYAVALRRLVATPYAELTEEEKKGDREQADKILMIVGAKMRRLRDEYELMRATLQGLVDSWEAGVDFDSRTLRPYINGARRVLGSLAGEPGEGGET